MCSEQKVARRDSMAHVKRIGVVGLLILLLPPLVSRAELSGSCGIRTQFPARAEMALMIPCLTKEEIVEAFSPYVKPEQIGNALDRSDMVTVVLTTKRGK
jgi:hypothetical protein